MAVVTIVRAAVAAKMAAVFLQTLNFRVLFFDISRSFANQ